MERWQWRLKSYKKAFQRLQEGVELCRTRPLSNIEKQGVIQGFEYTFELAWNLLRDYLLYQGILEIRGSRDAIRGAVKYGLIDQGERWLDMLETRNLTSHTYEEDLAELVLSRITTEFYPHFAELLRIFQELEVEDAGANP
ncbi:MULTISPECIES: nucleotidyltransferase substrate binding protein [unclassified Thermosynechococcus]|uniref:nucleotidyltransferase substrate binding protein n=1 Tax=unclassified Thermosynechococcus TaxID=2622553 RepID=UPI00285859DF|nr:MULTISPECIES: nucleotidyltransferase substrate binding protein [unclassified Thermosynechococcus]MDR5640058.1 nucleotidyltransferase substrate binding protein [Thermosynechococcus sp. PP42]MDR7922363.1 nucleotidyltransferase substrate binding protein [Thermosynechococcus sp. HY213]WNC29712.1 nucleotidyltransferase substrate binding protein [Thermosynechococcus sp. PKX82]